MFTSEFIIYHYYYRDNKILNTKNDNTKNDKVQTNKVKINK
jgi:hypothetical protein